MLVKIIAMFRGLPLILQFIIYSLVGASIGLALVIVRISNAVSYLSDSPKACINCHVMTDAFASWQRGSHGQTAICNDCHVPHSNIVSKFAFKATDGLKHSYIFTFRKEPQVIELSRFALPVVEDNCVRCHFSTVSMIRLADSRKQKCWDCHENFHSSVHGLSASPSQLMPELPVAGFK
jgi:cytochrome c nitrite reductase small subunit